MYGQPDPTLFPTTEWREVAQLALRPTAVREWAGDYVDADDSLLIEQLQQRVLPRRGIWAAPDEILITLGAQQALYLTSTLLLDSSRCAGIEQPSYPDIRNICRHFGATLRPLSMDRHGLRATNNFHGCDLVFVQPSHQNPTSATMPVKRRRELLEAASLHNFLIVEDDYDSELTFEGDPNPAIKALDREGRVIYVGSLSKTLAPGLRLGYLVGSSAFIAEARAMRRLSVRHAPSNNQRAIALFLQLGHHDAAIKRLVAAYRERALLLAKALHTHLPEIGFEPPTGGSALWAQGPEHVSMTEVSKAAAAQGLLLDTGAVFFHSDTRSDRFLRIGYSSIAAERIDPGIRLLADIMHARQSP